VPEDEDEAPEDVAVYRDGMVHVLAEKCPTCIFRSVNDGRIQLNPGRVAGMVMDARAHGSVIPCHTTIWEIDTPAICRGYWDLPRRVALLQVAERLGIVVFDQLEE
jgi:hypothetical protein